MADDAPPMRTGWELDADAAPAIAESAQQFFCERAGGPFVIMSMWPTPDLAPLGFEFGVDAPPGTVAPLGLLEIPAWRMWVGFVDGRAVATSAAHVVHGVNRVEWVSVLGDVRGRGYGEAITWAATVADPQLPAMLFSSDLGRPTYERMGFIALTRFTLWLGARA